MYSYGIIIQMGQTDSNEKSVPCIDHEVFSKAKSLNNGGQRRIMTTTLTTEEQYETWRQRLTNMNPNSQCLLLPLRHNFAHYGLCGGEGELVLEYEYFPNLLKEEIEKRRLKHIFFQESDLWYLLYCILDAQFEMWRGMNKGLERVNPSNIFLSNQGNVKVFGQISCPERVYQHQVQFLAPQQQAPNFMKGSETMLLAEIFSIGLTLLCAASIIDGSIFYQGNKINLKKIKKHLQVFKNNKMYSQVITAVVLSMLEFDPVNRIKPYQLWQWIDSYEQPILEKEDFHIYYLPPIVESFIINRRTNDYQKSSLTNQYIFQSPLQHSEKQNNILKRASLPNYEFNDNSQYYSNIPQAKAPPHNMITTFNPNSQQNYFRPENNHYPETNIRAANSSNAPYLIHPSSQRVISSVYLQDPSFYR